MCAPNNAREGQTGEISCVGLIESPKWPELPEFSEVWQTMWQQTSRQVQPWHLPTWQTNEQCNKNVFANTNAKLTCLWCRNISKCKILCQPSNKGYLRNWNIHISLPQLQKSNLQSELQVHFKFAQVYLKYTSNLLKCTSSTLQICTSVLWVHFEFVQVYFKYTSKMHQRRLLRRRGGVYPPHYFRKYWLHEENIATEDPNLDNFSKYSSTLIIFLPKLWWG